MTGVCGGREGGVEKAAASPLLFPLPIQIDTESFRPKGGIYLILSPPLILPGFLLINSFQPLELAFEPDFELDFGTIR